MAISSVVKINRLWLYTQWSGFVTQFVFNNEGHARFAIHLYKCRYTLCGGRCIQV